MRRPRQKRPVLTEADLEDLERLVASQRQLDSWVAGHPEHNDIGDECCPDFSCCRPELLAPEHERQAFADADEDVRMQMLGGFLGRASASADKSVYVAGLPPTSDTEH